MDFFQAQEEARRRTGLLVVLFGAAVLAIIVAVYIILAVGLGAGLGTGPMGFDPVFLAVVAVGTVGLIAGGSAVRMGQLRKGGPAVAELMGARAVDPTTKNPAERRLVNVVEEMSIASGIPVPSIYVMDDEDGINAFAAGWGIHDAAVAVTRGTLETLNRDELQGVVAHEFAHILNGDMRLNIRLMGILFGILLLAVVGRGFLRSTMFRGGGGRNRNSGGGAIAMGLALVAVGYIGVFFGKLIKAAVSRQREFLADAAAVQFTRNPRGIGGALARISDHTRGGKIRDHHAEELSHLFFANGMNKSLSSMLSTHPPLKERIRRIDAAVLEEPEPSRRRTDTGGADSTAAGGKGASGTAGSGAGATADAAGPFGGMVGVAAALALMESVGDPHPEHVQHARRILEQIPDPLRDAAHEPEGARALLLALLGGDNEETRTERRTAAGPLADRMTELARHVRDLPRDAYLPLVDMALPSLEKLSPDEAARFRAGAEGVVRADGDMRVFDFALLHILWRHLPGDRDRSRGRKVRKLRGVRAELGLLLSALAHAGADTREEAEAAFATGLEALARQGGDNAGEGLRLMSREAVTLPELDGALDRLELGTMEVRRQVLEAGAAVVLHDPALRTSEIELLRAVAESLELPLPPLIPATSPRANGDG
ncbi:MAG: hypothetical protein EA352_07610 [Gemmatimonadales bacterium]|nr:MAG: hypothetical protein EA352_07610 [Gemmatimonadales bacterium]